MTMSVRTTSLVFPSARRRLLVFVPRADAVKRRQTWTDIWTDVADDWAEQATLIRTAPQPVVQVRSAPLPSRSTSAGEPVTDHTSRRGVVTVSGDIAPRPPSSGNIIRATRSQGPMARLRNGLLIVLVLLMSALAGCVESEPDDGDESTATMSTLDTIHERGMIKCGVKDSQAGMGFLNTAGDYEGLDIEYCKALAAAVFGDTTKVEYVLATGSNRFDLLASGEIDVLIRTTTWTTSRDADLNADFAAVNFYDGQAIMTQNTNATSALELDGALICVATGTTTEGNLVDYFATNGLNFTAIASEGDAASKASYESGACDAWTGDASNLAAQKAGLASDVSAKVMPELLSKEPLASATRDNDADWNDVVAWTWYAMLTAEELGISSTSVGSADQSVPAIGRLLGGAHTNLGLGTEDHPLSDTAFKDVISMVGNYQEIYDRALCDGDGMETNCLVDRAGSLNAPHWEGGLMYAPPMR